jgi:hypothetical protein
MKRLRALLPAMAGFWLALTGVAEPIQLQPQTNLLANGVALNPGSYTIPCVADWNGDGLPDLIVGYEPAWKVAVYTNSGTLALPVFTAFNNIQAGGTDIVMPQALTCGSPAPFVCDYDNDGKRDLLVGQGDNGKVWFFRNTNTDRRPILVSGVLLKLTSPDLSSSSDLSVSSRAAPCVCDWDGDGLNDLLCGAMDGNVHCFRNVGTAQNPVYTNNVLLQTGGSLLNFGSRSVVRVCDWDGDGKKDLIGSGMDNAGWCRNTNTGGSATPLLAPKVALQAPTAAGILADIDTETATSTRMRLEVTDWNHDGVPDLLVGSTDGKVYLYEGYHFASQKPLPLPGSRCALQWNSAPFLKYKVLWGSVVSGVTNSAATGLASGGKVTCWTNSTSDPIRFYRVATDP